MRKIEERVAPWPSGSDGMDVLEVRKMLTVRTTGSSAHLIPDDNAGLLAACPWLCDLALTPDGPLHTLQLVQGSGGGQHGRDTAANG